MTGGSRIAWIRCCWRRSRESLGGARGWRRIELLGEKEVVEVAEWFEVHGEVAVFVAVIPLVR